MKEYGGYLSLDINGLDYIEKHYSSIANIRKYNSARYAMISAFKSGGFSCLWIPVYMCNVVYEVFKENKIEYKFYNINEIMEPDIDSIEENECILIANYYGLKDVDFYKRMGEKYNNIIFDNSHCFFMSPYLKHNIFNVYSPRKFLGVSDGAYLLTVNDVDDADLKVDISSGRSTYLLKSLEMGTNGVYHDYLLNEKILSDSGIRKMSRLTECLLCNIEYESVKKRRACNFKIVNDLLYKYNTFNISIQDNVYPMTYPLYNMNLNDEFRNYLISNKIYIPQWWRYVINLENATTFEKNLSEHLFPIPIDQRYNSDDLEYIAKIIINYIKEM